MSPWRVLAVLVVLGLAACQAPAPTAEPPTPAPAADAVPTPTPAPVPPAPVAEVEPTPAVAGDLDAFVSDLYGVGLSYPRGWEVQELAVPSLLAEFRASEGEDAPFMRLFLFYSAEEQAPSQVADELVTSLAQERGFHTISEAEVPLPDGFTGFQVTYAQGIAPRDSRGSLLVVVRGTQSFVVLLQAPRATYEANLDVYQEVLESLMPRDPRPFGYPREEILVLYTDDGPLHLDPAHAGSSREVRYIAQIFEGLVHINADLELEPNLAESWDIEDGVTYRFHLDPNARFHTGRPVTAQDVKESWERATDPETQSPIAERALGDIVGVQEKLAGEAEEISGVRVIDEATLEVTIDAPKAYFLAKLSHPATFVLDRENLAAGEGNGDPWWLNPVGTGPFRMGAWEPAAGMLLERHDEYHRGPARLPAVVFRFYGGVPVAMYESGEIDVALVGGGQVEELASSDHPLSGDLREVSELSVFYLGFDTTRPPFDDPAVRRAFLLATDRQRLLDEVIGASGQMAHGFLPPGIPGHDPELARILYDRDAAHRLLQDTEYGSAEALPRITYTPMSDGPGTQLLFAIWRDNLGANIQGALLPGRIYFELLETEKGNLYDYGWIASYPDPQYFLDNLFHSRSSANVGGYSNPEVDALLEQARTEQDHEERLGLYAQVERLLVEDAAAIPLYFGRSHVLVGPWARDYHPTPQGLVELRLVSLER